MRKELKGERGRVGIRYIHNEHDRERIEKVFRQFGTGNFTMSDIKNTVLADTNSGEICRWDSARIIECVGKTQAAPKKTPSKIWKLSDNVVDVMGREP